MTFAFDKLKGVQRRQVLTAIGAAGLFGTSPLALAQAPWRPSKVVRLVVPWPPGGASDILARYVAQGMGERLGQPVVVENRPGATATIGTTHVYESPADGTTLLLGIVDGNSLYPHLVKTRFDATRFVPIAPLGSSPYVLMGRPSLPATNLQELINLAKTSGLKYGSAGIGGSPQVMTMAFARAANIPQEKLLHVPYTGMAPALQALLGDSTIDILMVVVGGAAQYQGKVKFFGVTSGQRVEAVKDVPTLGEQGLSFTGEAWMGVVAPPQLPAPITAALWESINAVTSTPGFEAQLLKLGMHMLPGTLKQEEFAKYYLDEYRKWGEIVRVNNIKLE